jgi:hypothetical protein
MSSNIEEFIETFQSHFGGDAVDDALAEELQGIYAETLRARKEGTHGPDGSIWPENNAEYSARKGGRPVGILTEDMLSEENLKAEIEFHGDSIVMRYPGSEFAVQKLRWFEASGRKFWGLDPETRARFGAAFRAARRK